MSHRGAAGFALACATVAVLGFADGGYFPRAWGLAALALALVAARGLTVAVPLERGERFFAVGAIALLLSAALGLTWTSSVTLTMLELQRTALYALLVCAVVLTARGAGELLAGVLAGASLLTVWALFDHLVLDRDVDAFQGALLTGSIGYANALAAVAALGSIAAAGLWAGLPSRWPLLGLAQLLATGVALTNSRGALVAWVLGASVAVVLSRERMPLVAGLVLVGSCAIGVGFVAATLGVTRGRVASPDVVWEARAVFLLVAGSVVMASLFARFPPPPPRRRPGRRSGTLIAGFLLTAAVVATIGASPSLGDRRDYWHVALEAFGEKPVLGHGPGTFERLWLEDRPVLREARDAHSLYIEALAEQGLVGALLLLLVLALPLGMVIRRRGPMAAAAGGAYACFAAHAGLDWDWEMPVVTSAGLLTGVACLKVARPVAARALAERTRALLGTLLAVAVVGLSLSLIGNWHVTKARDRLDGGKPASALVSARRAALMQPWSSEPLVLAAQSRLLLGDRAGAREDLVRAVERDRTAWLPWWLLAITADRKDAGLAAREAERLNPLFVRSVSPP